MNTNDKKNTTEETRSHLPEENLNDVQGGGLTTNHSLEKRIKMFNEMQEKAKKHSAKAHDHGASGSW